MTSVIQFKGSPSGEIIQQTVPITEPTDDNVLVRVTHSGICGSDIHFRHRDMVLGHEGAGIVEKVGPRVVDMKKYFLLPWIVSPVFGGVEVLTMCRGDRVGWGFEHGSCLRCQYCLNGEEQYCPDRRTYGFTGLDQGSFATAATWPEGYLFKIPDNMTNAEAAPIMCAGASVFSPLRKYGVSPTHRVGIMGIGGLGHLAIQFAGKMGCEVIVLSRSEKKEEEARKLGATEFHVFSEDGGPPPTLKEPVDHLLVTTAKQPDWKVVCEIIANGGTIYTITITMDELKFPYMSIIDKAIHIQGSLPAPRAMHREMLRFAARHDIKPVLTAFPMTLDGINRAFDSLEQGTMRYRGVLVNE